MKKVEYLNKLFVRVNPLFSCMSFILCF